MKRCLIYILFISLSCSLVRSQDLERLLLTRQGIQGTGRYVGMAGAMAAVGGDVSAAKDNPAALGLFRRHELSATVDWMYDNVHPTDYISSNSIYHRMTVPQFSGVLTFRKSGREKGVISNSLMIQYHRLKTYGRNCSFDGKFTSSLSNLIANSTFVSTAEIEDGSAWENEDVGWLSKLAYDTYLIDAVAGTSNRYASPLSSGEQVTSRLRTLESGSQNEYSVVWGMNVSNMVYIGAGLNIRTYTYDKELNYTESFALGGNFELNSVSSISGAGANVNFGVIARPVNWLRLGLAMQTPSLMTLKFENRADLTTNGLFSDGVNNIFVQNTPQYSYTDKDVRLPLRTVAGMAFQIQDKSIISFEYDYQHHVAGQDKLQMEDLHFLKAGAEVAINQLVFLQVGYALQSTFNLGKEEKHYIPNYNSVRGDTDYKTGSMEHFASLGIGLRHDKLIMNFTYQLTIENADAYAYYGQHSAFDMTAVSNRLVVSFGWTPRDKN